MPGDDAVDPVLVAVLAQLWRACGETDDGVWSLAKLSKQAGVPMSGLRRVLAGLVEGGIVEVVFFEDGGGKVGLSEEGKVFCGGVFGE